jgi:hypothetical protein
LLYSFLCALASSIVSLHRSLSLAFFHHPFTSKVLSSFNTESSHLNPGLPFLLGEGYLPTRYIILHPCCVFSQVQCSYLYHFHCTRQAIYVQRNIVARSRKIVAVESNKYYLLVYVCMLARACMWVHMHARASMHRRAYGLANPALNAYAPYCDVICGPSVSTTFFDYLINGVIFGKRLLNIKCVFSSSLQLLCKHFLF